MYIAELVTRALNENQIAILHFANDRKAIKNFYKYYYTEEEDQYANELTILVLTQREKIIEEILKSYDNYFVFSLVEEGVRYTFPNIPVYTSFSKEAAMECFKTYVDEHEDSLDSGRFLKKAFEKLKKEALISATYELFFASKKPAKGWAHIEHCLLMHNGEIMHSRPLKDILQVLHQQRGKAYVDVFLLEKWAEDLFDLIEQKETKKSTP